MVPYGIDMRYGYRESLGSQPLNSPAALPAAVDEAVVHPAVPALPELDHLRTKQVTAPVSRAPHVSAPQLLGELLISPVELVPLDRPALRRDCGGELAVPGPSCEVGVGILRRQLFDLTPDTNLTVQLAPVDDQCRPGTGRQLLALRALVVAEEAETD